METFGSTYHEILKDGYKNVYIALPPLEEQEEIVEFLNKFTKNIDDRIGVKTKIVEKLQEYKKSLIYEVVTGKKEV